MLYRKLEIELDKWKNSQFRKPLILRGARQVGKTSLVRKWGQKNYDELIEINLEKKNYLEVFDRVESIADFINKVNVLTGKKIIPEKSLLFIDEIQESKNVMELLRFFAEERPDIHLIVAGSLLEAKMQGSWSVPVGRVEYLYLYPLTFFEYLRSIETGNFLNELEKIKIGDEIAGKNFIEKYLSDYILIGGMPEVISKFIQIGDFSEVKNTLSDLVDSYEDDIEKYSKGQKSKYISSILKVAPNYAGGLFNYENFGDLNIKSREAGEAIQKLEQVRLLFQIKSVNSTNLPLTFKYKRAKKMIFLDIGIVNEITNSFQTLLEGNYKGKIMEQFVGQTLIAGGTKRKIDLGYWAKNKDKGNAEVDFCFQYNDKIVAIEVKSGKTQEMKSLFSMIDSGGDRIIPIRVSWDKLGMEEYKYNQKHYKILSLPFYLLERWQDFIN